MSRSIESRYFQWLCDVINRSFDCPSEDNFPDNYRLLLNHLNQIEFRWVIDNDINRAADGIDLRGVFSAEATGNFYLYRESLMGPCTVLEMLVALARRCEESIMEDDDYGDRTGQWFWIMITNLGLNGCDNAHFDPEFVDQVIDNFMERNYEYDGSEGGIFVIENPPDDLRDTEIWYQLCWFLDAYFDVEGEN